MAVFTAIAAAGAGIAAAAGATAGTAAAVGTAATIGSAVAAGATYYEQNRKAANKKPVLPLQPVFDPFAVDGSAVIGAQKGLRKRLAEKSGLSSASTTGGIKSAATGQRPSLFTFS